MAKNLISVKVELHHATQAYNNCKEEYDQCKRALTEVETRLIEAREKMVAVKLEAEGYEEERQTTGSLDLEKADEIDALRKELPRLMEKIAGEKPLAVINLLDLDT
jgi:predicted  nucleic acid-binding Zn-ribbon protein